MTDKETTFDDYLKEQLKDPEFRKEWEKLCDGDVVTNNDLISRSELKKEFDIIASNSAMGEWQLIPIKHIKQIIDNASTVELDISEIEEKFWHRCGFLQGYTTGLKDKERPKGEWIDSGLEYKCSKCGVRYDIDITEITDFKFCPNCGAKMKGGKV